MRALRVCLIEHAPLFFHNDLCSCILPSLEQHCGSDSDDSDSDKVIHTVNCI